MTCDEIVRLVTDHLEGALDPATAARFEAHLAGCDACAEYVRQMRATIGALSTLPSPGVEDDARARLVAAFRAARGEGPAASPATPPR
jgi:anti-sigma factor RsiW